METGPGDLPGERRNREGVGERRNRDWETMGDLERGRQSQRARDAATSPARVKLLKKKKVPVFPLRMRGTQETPPQGLPSYFSN